MQRRPGFGVRWRGWIKESVSFAMLSLLIKVLHGPPFSRQGSLRQCNPLSSFLLMTCWLMVLQRPPFRIRRFEAMQSSFPNITCDVGEALSWLITAAISANTIKGFKPTTPTRLLVISNLQMMCWFCDTGQEEVKNIKAILLALKLFRFRDQFFQKSR